MRVVAEVEFTSVDPTTGHPCTWVSRRVRDDDYREMTVTEPLED